MNRVSLRMAITLRTQMRGVQCLPPSPILSYHYTNCNSSCLPICVPPPKLGALSNSISFSHFSNTINVKQNSSTFPVRDRHGRSRMAARASTAQYSPDIGINLTNVTIFTADGQPVMLKDLWDQDQGIAVVALLRHFGCPCCWELAYTLKEAKQRFDSAGVKLIAMGVGTPDKARILAERLPFPADCLYADPDRKVYELLDLYYGVARTFFNPSSAKVFSRFDTLRTATKHYTIDATPRDTSSVLQQGGMFVFKGKELIFARKDEGTGDHAPLDDVLFACCNAPVA